MNYMGPISGCMDPSACNFDPLAEMDDGSCLLGRSGLSERSRPDDRAQRCARDLLQLTTINVGPNDCYITEGCLSGYGVRDILRFTTHIKNIGNTDYYIGNPNANPDQFNLSNCHGHVHYEGYAEYLLSIPRASPGAGLQERLLRDGPGVQRRWYGPVRLREHGHLTGCGDIYSSGLNCQWVVDRRA